MAKHLKDKVWELRKDGNSNGIIYTVDKNNLHIYYYGDMNDPEQIIDFDINRNDARILARRILECLEASK
jgi:hypothetical protein